MWVCVRAGYCERAQLCFSTCEPHSGEGGLQGAEWAGPCPTEQNRERR